MKMPNIMDYIDWRGDLTMAKSEFNEVDNLILAMLAYVNLDDIVPPYYSLESISIKEASDLFFSKYSEKEILAEVSMTKMCPFLMRKMAESNRFSKLKLSRYVNKIDYREQKQFSAITIEFEDDTIYVAFRGTDNTIVGWKENFNMSFKTEVPAQLEAVRYLEYTTGRINKRIRIGGHSKGGNLAVYASVKASHNIKEKIIEVYNNDGPGFDKKMISSQEYKEMLAKIKTIVPQSSIVGMLLEHEEEYKIVKSNNNPIMQHNGMLWEVLGNKFVYVDSITKESKLLDVTLKSWVDKMEEAEREQFVDSLYYIFEATDVKNFGDLLNDKWHKLNEIRKVISKMAPKNREIISKTIKLLFKESSKVARNRNKIEQAK